MSKQAPTNRVMTHFRKWVARNPVLLEVDRLVAHTDILYPILGHVRKARRALHLLAGGLRDEHVTQPLHFLGTPFRDQSPTCETSLPTNAHTRQEVYTPSSRRELILARAPCKPRSSAEHLRSSWIWRHPRMRSGRLIARQTGVPPWHFREP